MFLAYYQRINPSLGFVEEVSLKSGRLYKVLKIDDNADTECTQLHCKTGFIFYSKSIDPERLSYYRSIDTATFLPCQASVKREICSQISGGKLITNLYKEYIARLPFPPYEVINKWAAADKDFETALVAARRFAARVRFDEALQMALDNKDNPKVLKTLVDILQRHAEIDDPDVFQAKGESGAQVGLTNITIITGIPQLTDSRMKVISE